MGPNAELAAVTGMRIDKIWVEIAKVDWPQLPAGIEMALCWRSKIGETE